MVKWYIVPLKIISIIIIFLACCLREQALSQETTEVNQDEDPQSPQNGTTTYLSLGRIYPCSVFEGYSSSYGQVFWGRYSGVFWDRDITRVEIITESSCLSEIYGCDEARTTALQLVNDKDLDAAIVGPWCAEEVADVYEAAKILHFVVFVDKLLPYSRYRFQSYYNWSSDFAYLINHVTKAGINKVGLAYPNHEKAVKRAKQLSTQIGHSATGNVSIVYNVTYLQHSEKSNLLLGTANWPMYSLDKFSYMERYNATLWDAMLLSMKEAGVEHAVFLSYGERVSIMNRIAELGINFQAISFDEAGPEMIHYLGAKADYITSTREYHYSNNGTFGVFGRNSYIVWSYDRMRLTARDLDIWSAKNIHILAILRSAVVEANFSKDREKLIFALSSMDYATFYSPVKFSSSNVNMNVSSVLLQVQDRKERSVLPSHIAASSIVMPIPPWECRVLLNEVDELICTDEEFLVWENCTQKCPYVNSTYSFTACMARRQEEEDRRNQIHSERNDGVLDSTEEVSSDGIDPVLGLVLVVILVICVATTACAIVWFRRRTPTLDGLWIPINEIDFELQTDGNKRCVGLARFGPVFKATYNNYQVVTKTVVPAAERRNTTHVDPIPTSVEIEVADFTQWSTVHRFEDDMEIPGDEFNRLSQARTSRSTTQFTSSKMRVLANEAEGSTGTQNSRWSHSRSQPYPNLLNDSIQGGMDTPGDEENCLSQERLSRNTGTTHRTSSNMRVLTKEDEGNRSTVSSRPTYARALSIPSIVSTPRISQGALAPFQSFRTSAKNEFESGMEQLIKWKHSNLLTVFGAYVDENNDWCMVTEYMAGGSLNESREVSTAEQGTRSLVKILIHVADGLLHLHNQDPAIVHGDIKASHVYMDHYFVPKIGNFCLYESDSKSEFPDAFWWAPERIVLDADGNVALLDRSLLDDTSVDVYSFGIMMWEVFSKQVPYAEQTLRKSIKEILEGVTHEGLRPAIPIDISEDIEELIRDCWHKDPEMRPNMKVVRGRLREIHEVQKEEHDMRLQDETQEQIENAQLLRQVLPPTVAEKLLKGEKVLPEEYDQATIFFSYITGFADISAKLEPQDVMSMLDRLYTKLDQVCSSWDLFKVETIGDTYMCAGGIAEKQPDQTARVCLFAEAAISAAKSVMVHEEKPRLGCVNMCAGIHTGRVIASVVGELNPRYCLFGDTVNTASRMASNSEKFEINLSPEANECLHEQVPKVKTRSRGIMNIKGKGPLECFFFEQSKENIEICRSCLNRRVIASLNH